MDSQQSGPFRQQGTEAVRERFCPGFGTIQRIYLSTLFWIYLVEHRLYHSYLREWASRKQVTYNDYSLYNHTTGIAFVEAKDGLKLPIGRRGTGVQQILTVLAYINRANSPFVGIEELEMNLSPHTQKVVFNSLLELINSKSSVVRQIIFTTHSPHIGKRNEAERRGVWMDSEKRETKVKKPSEAQIKEFFQA